jgi:hypothetical protein
VTNNDRFNELYRQAHIHSDNIHSYSAWRDTLSDEDKELFDYGMKQSVEFRLQILEEVRRPIMEAFAHCLPASVSRFRKSV